MDALLRVLELVRRELDAHDVFVQLGGRSAAQPDDAEDPCRLEHVLQPGCRLVVQLAAPPPDPEMIAMRLRELAGAFAGTVTAAVEALDSPLSRARSGHVLVDTLADLCEATGAAVALVVDTQSPVVWGCSEPTLGLGDRPTVERLAEAFVRLRARDLDPVTVATTTTDPSWPDDAGLRHALEVLRQAERARLGGAARLLATVDVLGRSAEDTTEIQPGPHGEPPGSMRKGFGGLYEVVLVMRTAYSPLRVEGVLRRALPIVERHVLDLPPLDPTPKGGRVVPLYRD